MSAPSQDVSRVKMGEPWSKKVLGGSKQKLDRGTAEEEEEEEGVRAHTLPEDQGSMSAECGNVASTQGQREGQRVLCVKGRAPEALKEGGVWTRTCRMGWRRRTPLQEPR